MAIIEGQIMISRPVETVFDYVADQTNEPDYNPRMIRSVRMTEGPIGPGTKFRAEVRSAGRTVSMVVEFTDFVRPWRLASVTTMEQADIDYLLWFESVPEGTLLHWSSDVRPSGWSRVLTPLIGWLGSRQEQETWEGLKRHLEAASPSLAKRA